MNIPSTSLFRLLQKKYFRMGGLLTAAFLLLGSISLNAQTYCTPAYSSGCAFQDDINSFTFTAASNSISDLNTGCTAGGYANRTSLFLAAGVLQGSTYSGTVTTNYSGSEYYTIWIDFNNDGVFTNGTGLNGLGNENLTGLIGPFGSSAASPYSITIPITATPGTHRMRVRLAFATSGAMDPCNSYSYGETHDYNVNVIALTPCTGQPVAGTVTPGGPIAGCPGSTYTFNTNGTTTAGNLTYLWMQSTNGGTSYTPAAGTNNQPSYVTPALSANIRYHMIITCTTSGLKDSTADVLVNISGPTYASVPYTQDFESWINGCTTTDIPSNNWTNQPPTGDRSWRREDQGASANWTFPTSGVYSPPAAIGAHSARFHSYYAPANQSGSLSLFVNCSGFTSALELQLYLRTDPSTFGNDSLKVYMSTDGGQTFGATPIAVYGPGNGQWQYFSQLFNSTSATTVLRFDAKANYQYYTDMGLDYVRILPPCAGKPVAGVVNPVTPCPNTNFTLSLTGTSQAAGLTYQWQYLNSSNVWTPINPGNTPIITYNISQNTSVRAIVTCANSTQADTTAPYLVSLASFYYCYCSSGALYNYSGLGPNIGNVTINRQPNNATVLNNGVGTPTNNNTTATQFYTDFRYTVSAPCLYRDSLYKMFVSQINPATFYASTVTAFIDYNRDGNYSVTAPSERLFTKNTAAGTPTVNDTFRIPTAAQIGTTGMRVVIVYGTGATINPCGTYSYGETEDYLVNICYPPCTGPANAGTALATDTVICPGYTIDLTDTTHEKLRSGLVWVWQASTNGGFSWSNLPNATNKDTLNNVLVTGPIKYRLRMLCTITGDTTYSNVLNITNGLNFQCYPLSQSIGNRQKDTSDIGSFSIGNYIMPVGMTAGPHVMNPLAIRHRTDNTQPSKWIYLNADSTYPMAIYHTLSSLTHGDARVSVFMDFNNDLQYNALFNSYPYSPERIFTGLSTNNPAGWYVTTNITIPNAVIPETPTGLRVIVNSDTNPNAPANLGTGPYVSGETEDYVVVFHRYDPTKVSTTGLVKDVIMYPNPTEGRVTLGINSSKDIAQLDVVVTTVTGQTVLSRSYTHTGTQFTTDLNLAGYASGVYLMEVRADGDRIVRKLVIR